MGKSFFSLGKYLSINVREVFVISVATSILKMVEPDNFPLSLVVFFNSFMYTLYQIIELCCIHF